MRAKDLRPVLGCLLLLVACLCGPAWAGAGPHLPMVQNLARDAGPATPTVYLILVSQEDCRYCDQIRAAYLRPLLKDKPARLVLREVSLTSSRPMKDFSGAITTHKDFAARYQVKVTPTLLFLDRTGLALTRPLPGADTAGFYGAYLQSSLDKAFKAVDSAL